MIIITTKGMHTVCNTSTIKYIITHVRLPLTREKPIFNSTVVNAELAKAANKAWRVKLNTIYLHGLNPFTAFWLNWCTMSYC